LYTLLDLGARFCYCVLQKRMFDVIDGGERADC